MYLQYIFTTEKYFDLEISLHISLKLYLKTGLKNANTPPSPPPPQPSSLYVYQPCRSMAIHFYSSVLCTLHATSQVKVLWYQTSTRLCKGTISQCLLLTCEDSLHDVLYQLIYKHCYYIYRFEQTWFIFIQNAECQVWLKLAKFIL